MEKTLDDLSRASNNLLAKLRDIMLANQPAGFIPCTPYHSDRLNPSQQEAGQSYLIVSVCPKKRISYYPV